MMKIIVAQNGQDMGRKAASIIAAQVVLKPDSVLGLATGSSPVTTYRQLVEWYKNGDLDFSRVTTINLDEYVGLGHDNDQSYFYFMRENLFKDININMDNVFLPNGLAADPDAECARYEALIAEKGPIDLQVLGIGVNGHIGFNEPDSTFECFTHVVELTQSTIDANARFFATADAVPKRAMSMGMQGIMQAKRIVMLASGEQKADALYKAFCGKIDPAVPASILRLHPDVTLVADAAALSKFD